MPSVRFHCPSASLSLRGLLKRTRRALWIGLVLALGMHVISTQWSGFGEEQKITKPLTTQFVKRQPRLTKPLELKKRPRPKRRNIQRKMVAVKARMDRQQRISGFQPIQVLQGLARPQVAVGRGISFQATELEPQAVAEAIAGSKEAKNAVDMSLELLDIDALDTGQYHAMVVQDPSDKRNIQGFCHLAAVYLPRLHEHVPIAYAPFNDYVMGSVRRLVEAMNRYTDIRTDLKGRLVLGDSEMFKTPWVFMFIKIGSYDLSDQEMDFMGRYMMAGGFVFADARGRAGGGYAGIDIHTGNLLGCLETQGVSVTPEKLPSTHPIYHCYFDFEGPPPGADASHLYHKRAGYENFRNAHLIDHLGGLIVDGRLLAILSDKGYYHPWATWRPSYYHPWCQKQDPTLQLQFGVNVIIFSLIQEGSITHRVMDTLGH